MPETLSIDALKHDVAATLGDAQVAVVDRNAALLLPLTPAEYATTKLIDDVQQEFHDTFVDTAWPHCPAHPNHPLWFEDGAWRCSEFGKPIAKLGDLDTMYFNDAIEGWRRGDFDRLAPLFAGPPGDQSMVIRWLARGRFANHPAELAEALSNACFLGRETMVAQLIAAGVDVTAGAATGMDGIHWAVNRGKIETVRLLIALGAPLETINMHGTTALGTAVWSAINEPWWGEAQIEIIQALVDAGANIDGAGYPTGDPGIDALLRGRGAT